MNDELLVECLAKLGNITRLKIYKLLVKAGNKGMSVGLIQSQLNIPASTLSHHLSKLISLELVIQKRDGRVLTCTANYDLLDEVVNSLKSQCCSGL